MSKANQISIPLFKEGINALKVLPSYLTGHTFSRPISVNLLITSRCNSKCITCDSWKLTDHDNELTLLEFERIAQDMAKMQIPIVTIGGGEPTLRKDIWEIIKGFKKNGIQVQLTTNGLKMTSSQRQSMYESGLDRVTISMDSHIPSVYEKIRGVDGAEQVMTNILTLLKEKPDHLQVDTNTVLCTDNADTFLETIDFLITTGIPKVNFSAVTTSGNNYLITESKAALAEIPQDKIEQIVKGLLERKKETGKIQQSKTFIQGLAQYYKNPNKTVFPCYAGYLTLDIFQDGSVHGCGNLPKVANIRDGSIKEIWASKKAEENRRNMAQGKCPNCYLSCKMELAIAGNIKHLPSFSIDKVLST